MHLPRVFVFNTVNLTICLQLVVMDLLTLEKFSIVSVEAIVRMILFASSSDATGIGQPRCGAIRHARIKTLVHPTPTSVTTEIKTDTSFPPPLRWSYFNSKSCHRLQRSDS
jgi:hypothetical protein